MTRTSDPIRLLIDGQPIDVHVAHADDRAVVRAVLAAFPGRAADRPAVHTCCVERAADGLWTIGPAGQVTHRAVTIEDALLAVEWQIVSDVLSRNIDRFHLHGAALADPSGATTVLVLGDSGVGKTTLTLALMAHGFRPFADDVVLLDPERFTPEHFPRAFHVDATTRALVSPLFAGASWEHGGLPLGYCLPLTWAGASVPVGAIVFPRAHDHARPSLMAMAVPDATLALLSFTSSLDRNPALALRTAARLTGRVPAYALDGGPLAATVDLVASTVAALVASAGG